MKKIIILLSIILLASSCQSSNRINNKISNKNFEDVKQSIKEKESFILWIGRSDCSDCTTFEDTLSHISIPKNTTFVKLDIKKYRDLANRDNASKKDIDYYNNLKNFFNLKWTPTLYYIKRGKIVSTYQYLDEEYHSSSEKDKIKKKKQFDHEAENFIKNFKN